MRYIVQKLMIVQALMMDDIGNSLEVVSNAADVLLHLPQQVEVVNPVHCVLHVPVPVELRSQLESELLELLLLKQPVPLRLIQPLYVLYAIRDVHEQPRPQFLEPCRPNRPTAVAQFYI